MVYVLANTTVTILRGVANDPQGDIEDSGHQISTGTLAQINAARNGTFGVRTFEPAFPIPSTLRLYECVLPSGTDIENTDQVVDERSGQIYEVMSVVNTRWEYRQPDLELVLKLVTGSAHN